MPTISDNLFTVGTQTTSTAFHDQVKGRSDAEEIEGESYDETSLHIINILHLIPRYIAVKPYLVGCITPQSRSLTVEEPSNGARRKLLRFHGSPCL